MSIRIASFVAAVLLLPAVARAADPEKLPAPKEKAAVAVPTSPEQYMGFRVDRYAVWQNYEVDRWGRFRPVVVNSPYGAYYRINGQPFPWVPTHSQEFARKVVE